MKQSFFIILAIFFIIICIVCVVLINLNLKNEEIKNENAEYEKYLDEEISGTELATLINKAIEENITNSVEKDENNYYIDNGKNSIKIDLKMITIDKTYPMEEIYNNEITQFVQNFNTVKFKCTSIEYHTNTGKVSKLVFEEQE